MERSISSSVNTSMTTSEESSWTSYFEYFYASRDKDNTSENSVVSDAASSCAGSLPFVGLDALSGPCKNVKVKKRRVHGLLEEDPLEDTASSPVNSPKISDLIQLQLSPPNYVGPSKRDSRMVPEEGKILQTKGEECTELKKRGLCLVPVSLLLDYVG